MDERAYAEWWELHLRASKGELLTPEETAAYQGGAAEFDRDDRLNGDLDELRRLRDAVRDAQAEQAALHARQAELAAEITRLEAMLGDGARHALGVGD